MHFILYLKEAARLALRPSRNGTVSNLTGSGCLFVLVETQLNQFLLKPGIVSPFDAALDGFVESFGVKIETALALRL